MFFMIIVVISIIVIVAPSVWPAEFLMATYWWSDLYVSWGTNFQDVQANHLRRFGAWHRNLSTDRFLTSQPSNAWKDLQEDPTIQHCSAIILFVNKYAEYWCTILNDNGHKCNKMIHQKWSVLPDLERGSLCKRKLTAPAINYESTNNLFCFCLFFGGQGKGGRMELSAKYWWLSGATADVWMIASNSWS